jgi:hypothetical protein
MIVNGAERSDECAGFREAGIRPQMNTDEHGSSFDGFQIRV